MSSMKSAAEFMDLINTLLEMRNRSCEQEEELKERCLTMYHVSYKINKNGECETNLSAQSKSRILITLLNLINLGAKKRA